MEIITVREYRAEDREAVIALAKRNLLEVNSKDYPKELMEKYRRQF